MILRIDKALSENLCITRKEAKKMLSDARVKIDSEICKKSDFKIDTEKSVVEIDGKKLNLSQYIYIMMNKPSGVVSATTDAQDVSVVNILPPEYKRKNVFPAGRLDKDTVGFILLTNDGDFAHRILSPKNHIEKTYEADIQKDLSDEDIMCFENGIVLSDGTKCIKAKCKMIDDKKAQIKIVEGKYHQVKRMFASLDNKVLKLKRTSMGNLTLDENLAPGECRIITAEELKLIEKNDKM